MKSGLLYWILSVASWLVPLLLILLCAWIVLRNVRQDMKENVTTAELFNIPKVRPRGEVTIWIGSMLMMLAVGLGTGYGLRNIQLINNTRMYFGVVVLSQQNDHEYIVRIPGYDRTYDWEFCHPLKMPAALIDIKYEQRFGCKAVNGVGFVAPHEEKHNAEL